MTNTAPAMAVGRVAHSRVTLLLAGFAAVGVVLVALAGPLLGSRSPTAPVGLPFEAPTGAYPAGTDAVGRDVLSRLLHGGRAVVLLAIGATALASLCGALLGVFAGLIDRRTGELVVRVVDVVAVVPGLLVLLVLAAGFPGSDSAVLVGVALVSLPFSVRVLRAATWQVAVRGFVDTARARGDSRWRIIRYDLVPNIVGTMLAEAGIRFSAAVHLTATAGFLGLGAGPPTPNWGRMVSENAAGINLTVWPVLLPALLLVLFTVSVNLLADDLAARWADR
ncbi:MULTISPECIES: ABC transporter permease [unclassified Solwaraspora]|uniref:ABC transporter permease n=1 Tax=unclassified Solwaraspora TaxID=2627926 RepID=UPI00248B8882|nr:MULTISPECIES: ABC transporter permease [unclassified Solwaraspora]WBB99833.1 ABC transporter permease [Solwaraspora sp. WMMA2059]WBC21619.1 ABC transporter permease [Solwaraspora sp. WMMA2080]WJK36339.1 ABC transporter permease [Solwaraspora sp. WMMA2065]